MVSWSNVSYNTYTHIQVNRHFQRNIFLSRDKMLFMRKNEKCEKIWNTLFYGQTLTGEPSQTTCPPGLWSQTFVKEWVILKILSTVLTEFERGAFILNHPKSVFVSSILDIRQSAISGIIAKWNLLGTKVTQPWESRSYKVAKQSYWVLMLVVKSPPVCWSNNVLWNHQDKNYASELHGIRGPILLCT